MAVPAAPAKKPSLLKREPLIIGQAAISLLATVLYEASAIGLGSNPIFKILAGVIVVAGTFGIRVNVKPV